MVVCFVVNFFVRCSLMNLLIMMCIIVVLVVSLVSKNWLFWKLLIDLLNVLCFLVYCSVCFSMDFIFVVVMMVIEICFCGRFCIKQMNFIFFWLSRFLVGIVMLVKDSLVVFWVFNLILFSWWLCLNLVMLCLMINKLNFCVFFLGFVCVIMIIRFELILLVMNVFDLFSM